MIGRSGSRMGSLCIVVSPREESATIAFPSAAIHEDAAVAAAFVSGKQLLLYERRFRPPGIRSKVPVEIAIPESLSARRMPVDAEL